MPIFFRITVLVICCFLSVSGCALTRHAKAENSGAGGVAQGTVKQRHGLLGSLFPRKPAPPPRASVLLAVGTVRKMPEDGTYAVIEMEPGTLVRMGEDLIVTSGKHSVARLKASEIQPPYFVAEVLSGAVTPGDVVKR